MDFWAEHWLSVGVGVFWLSMILYGHYRGLVRIAVTMSALILSLVVTRVAMPCVTAVAEREYGSPSGNRTGAFAYGRSER